LIRQLAQVASRGGNYLLNVGPTSEGVIPQPSVDRLAEVGRWMKLNSDSIYGTSASPFPYEMPWGVLTAKPGKLYLHVFQWPGKEFVIYGIESKVRRAYLLSGASPKPLAVTQRHHQESNLDELHIAVPAEAPDAHDSVIVLETAGAVNVTTTLLQQPDHKVTLPAYLANVHHAAEGSQLRFDSRGVVERWLNKDEWLGWDFQVSSPGEFDVVAITSGQKYGQDWEGGHRLLVTVAGKDVAGTISDDGKVENPSNPYWPYVQSRLGHVEIAKAGKYNLSIKPQEIVADKKFGLTLVSIQLVPR
jgi:alpha-L-fucosidase